MDAEGSFGLPNGTKAQITAIAIMSAITLHMIIPMSVAVEIRKKEDISLTRVAKILFQTSMLKCP